MSHILKTMTGRTGNSPMNEARPIVFVIDDDVSVREGLADVLNSVGLGVQAFSSTQEFLDYKRADAPGCIVLDVRLPDRSGLEFQQMLNKLNIQLPVVFISAHGDVPITVRAMKSGAIEFLTKPLRAQELLDAVQDGIERDRVRRQGAKLVADLQDRFDSLTPREREIMGLIVVGEQAKQVAARIKVSELTVRAHRSHIMTKMQARTIVDLVRMADQLGSSAKASTTP